MENKKKLIRLLQETYCRVKRSSIDGVGVVAIRDIPAGTNPFIGSNNPEAYTCTQKELSNLHPEVLRMIEDFLPVNKDGTIDIPVNGLNSLDISFFLNTSKSPNVATSDGVFFKTARDIKKGEELTADYSTYDYEYKKKQK